MFAIFQKFFGKFLIFFPQGRRKATAHGQKSLAPITEMGKRQQKQADFELRRRARRRADRQAV